MLSDVAPLARLKRRLGPFPSVCWPHLLASSAVSTRSRVYAGPNLLSGRAVRPCHVVYSVVRIEASEGGWFRPGSHAINQNVPSERVELCRFLGNRSLSCFCFQPEWAWGRCGHVGELVSSEAQKEHTL